MAETREPPPLFDEDDNIEKEADSDDIFSPSSQPKKPNPEDRVEDHEDLFTDAISDVPLDSPERQAVTENGETDEPPKLNVSAEAATKPASPREPQKPDADDVEADEESDQFSIEITITDPKKIGDGMGAYMAYQVNTKTTLPTFRRPELSVMRRFSDFLGLHDKLLEKHLQTGRIIPPPPEKSVMGMTKVKVSKEDAGSNEFIEKRRASLERFLNRTARHPVLRMDPIFREFLEHDGELAKSSQTSALSGAGVLRLFNKVGEAVGKMTFKMDETDQWFEDKQQQVEALDQQLRKLHGSVEALVMHRKELAANTGSFAKSAAMLGNAEEHTALSRALSQLAEIEEKLDQLHMDQADNDFFVFSELVKDYVFLIASVKEVFQQRVKIFKTWKEAELTLTKKRENKAKMELQRKMDKIPQAQQEITEWENRVEKGQEEFEAISKMIRKEMVRFDKQRVKDFKTTIIHYMESLMNSQQQVIKYWETFIPEAKAIA